MLVVESGKWAIRPNLLSHSPFSRHFLAILLTGTEALPHRHMLLDNDKGLADNGVAYG